MVTNKLFQTSTMTARKHASLTSSLAVQSYITRGSVQLAKKQNKKLHTAFTETSWRIALHPPPSPTHPPHTHPLPPALPPPTPPPTPTSLPNPIHSSQLVAQTGRTNEDIDDSAPDKKTPPSIIPTHLVSQPTNFLPPHTEELAASRTACHGTAGPTAGSTGL